MLTVFLYEFKALLRDIKAITCITLYAIASGILFTVNCMISTYPGIEQVLSTMTLVATILITFIAASSLTKDKKKGTDALLSAMPFTKMQILAGKFLAVLTLFLIPTAIMAIYPIVLLFHGFTALGNAYIQLFVFVLIEAFFTSFGIMISALFKKTWHALVAAYSTFLVLFICGVIYILMPNSALAGLIFLLALALVVGACLWLATKRTLIVATVSGVALVVPTILFFAFPSVLVGSFETFLKFLSPFRHFDSFIYGLFSLGSIILYISFAVLFLYLAEQIQRGNKIKTKPRKPADMGKAVTCTVAVALCLCINIGIFALPERFTKFDITQNRIYKVSDESKSYLDSLEEEINIYLIDAVGDEKVGGFIRRYCELSSKINLIEVNSVSNTEFLEKLGISANTQAYSMVVESAKRKKTVTYEQYFTCEHAEIGYMSLSEYQYLLAYYQQMYTQYSSSGADQSTLQQILSMYQSLAEETKLCFKAEEAIGSAIEYVTAEYIPTIYFLSGNGEKNTEANPLDISAEFPPDAGLILINAPSEDYTDAEVEKLIKYTDNGGRLLVLSNEETHTLPNFTRLMASYGLSASEKLKNGESTVFDATVNTNLFASSSQTLKLDGVCEIIVDDKIKESSAAAIGVTVTEKQAGEDGEEPEDVKVGKNVGVSVYKNGSPYVTWITGADSFNASTNGMSEEEENNYVYVMNFLQGAVNGTKRSFETKVIYPTPRIYDNSILTVDEGDSTTVGVIFIGVIPLIMAGAALLGIYAKRKRSLAVEVEE